MAAKPERASWRKVWTSFYSTPSHLALDALALHVGVVVIVHASWSPTADTDDAELLDGKGLPMSRANLARLCRLTEKIVARCLDDLVEAGTLEVRLGTVVVPRFRRWQETADAARKRKVRGGQSEIFPRQAEAEEEADADPSLRSGERASPATRRSKADTEAIALRVVTRLIRLRGELQGKASTMDPRDHLQQVLARLRGGATEEQLTAVVEARAQQVREDAWWLTHFDPTSPFRPANWGKSLALVDLHQAGKSLGGERSNGKPKRPEYTPEQQRRWESMSDEEADAEVARLFGKGAG